MDADPKTCILILDDEPIVCKRLKSAFEKAERYRLLNEPKFAESICITSFIKNYGIGHL